ncbi:TPA: hypothetical protein EYP84_02875 [Candidatus Bipolaricaulota bacterium]|nr:hypothetical protein [Candidatus Bipolaricaulota bacterium]
MLDLGPEEERYHREVVEEARWQGVDALFAYGPRMCAAFSAWEGPGAGESEDLEALVGKIREEAGRLPSLILVKGSRGLALERAVEALIAD